MRKALYTVGGAMAGLLIGTLLSVPFNYWYSAHFIHSDADSNFLVSLLVFGIWPVSVVAGVLFGRHLFRRAK